LNALKAELINLTQQSSILEEASTERKNREKRIETLKVEIEKLDNEIESIKQNKVYENAFEWRFEFPEILDNNGDFIGFDVIIGNPPYIQIQKFSGQPIQTALQQQNYSTFVKTGDIYALFIEKGISLLKSNGILSFITSNKWMRAGYGKALRGFLAYKTQPLKLIDFGGYQVFESATVDSNILITQNSLVRTASPQRTSSPQSQLNACTIQKDFTIETSLNDYFNTHQQTISLKLEEAWVISSNIEQQIKEKIERIGTPLKDWDISINYGIKTGFNEAFIIDTVIKERLCLEDPKSAEIIKPILRGRDIKRYSAEWAGLWIIATFPALHLDIENYPAIKNYLESFGKRLEQSGENGCRKKTCNKWFEVQDTIAYWKEFEKEKIVWASVGETYFSIVDKGLFLLDTNYFTSSLTKYHLVLLNSNLLVFYLNGLDTSIGNGGAYRHYKYNFEQIPIPKIPESEQQPFIELVDKILLDKKAGRDTKELEEKIDQLVYKLYELSEEEINIVEGK